MSTSKTRVYGEGERPRIEKTSDITRFKALDDSTGAFEAIVSVYGTIDLQGDVTMPGAHTKSIEKWRQSGDPIPVIWSHAWSDPEAHIGWVDPNDMHEVIKGEKSGDRRVTGGLYVKGHIDMDKPFARHVYDLLKQRRVREWSWAYDVVRERKASDGANELLEVNIFEIGPTLKGAHPDTLTLAVKADTNTKESTAARTLRNHMDSGHAQAVRAYKPTVVELTVRHRLLHADLAPVSERHLTTGIPDGDTVPATTGYSTASLDRIANDVRRDRRVDAYVKQARANAKRDRLLDVSEKINAAHAAASATAGLTIEQMQEVDRQREAWQTQKAQAAFEMRERERAEEAARSDMQALTPEEFQALQLQRVQEADAALLAQEGETFTMALGPNGELKDP